MILEKSHLNIVNVMERVIIVSQNSKAVLTDYSVFYRKVEKYDKRKDRC